METETDRNRYNIIERKTERQTEREVNAKLARHTETEAAAGRHTWQQTGVHQVGRSGA